MDILELLPPLSIAGLAAALMMPEKYKWLAVTLLVILLATFWFGAADHGDRYLIPNYFVDAAYAMSASALVAALILALKGKQSAKK